MKLLLPVAVATLFISESIAQRVYATPSATSISSAPESTPSGYTDCHPHEGGELHCTDAAGVEASCHQHDGGEWHCEVESESAGTGSSPEGYSDCHSHGTEMYCVSDSTGAEDLCHQENGEWHCESESAASAEEVVDSNGCVQHGTHLHCPEGVSEPCSAQLGDYDMGLHVAALFVLLVSSGVGVFLPVIFASKKAARGRFSSSVIYIRDNVLRHFGSGVIISTTFIHLLLHAFVMFSSDCLGELAYEPTAPAIMMASTLLIFTIDFLAARALTKKFFNSNNTSGQSSPIAESPVVDEKKEGFGHTHDFSAVASEIMAKDPLSKRAHWEVQLLEAGIIFHSIMIGVALGAQGGSTFVATWLAITFHQLFEGMGLGARIARLEWHSNGALKKFFMCLAYNLTTPLGVGIGMGVRNSFNLGATSTLLTIGILDSISAGILLYAGIAQLLVGDWLAGDLRTAKTSTVIVAAVSLLAGIIAMSVIGKWA